MPVSGPSSSSPSPPAIHRLVLALSVAALAHTLILAALAKPFSEPELNHRLAFELVSRPSVTSDEAAADTPEPRHLPFRLPGIQPVQEPSAPATQPVQPLAFPSPPDNFSASNPSSPPSLASKSRPDSAMEDSPVRQISESPEERDPYLRKLATHLAVQLDDQRVPSISTLKQTVAVTLELRLLPSGALTRAQVVDSTGIESLDEVAYKAALAASPYPSPEGETTDRFRVQLLFTPKRS